VQRAPQRSDCLIEDAYVLTLDDAGTRGRLSVAVQDGHVAATGPRTLLRERFPRLQRHPARRRILLPGLVNAHLHPDLHVLKGELEQLDLHDWRAAARFNAAVDLLGTPDGAAIRQASIMTSLAEAALSGATCVATYGVSDGADAACEEALAAIGLRGTVTIRANDFAPRHDGGNAWDRPVPSHYRLHAEEALFEQELQDAAAALRRGERLVMHAAETRERIRIVRERFGTTTIRLLERHGLLTPALLLSHAIHIDEHEVGLIARGGASVVVSPAAEMKLGDGTPPVQDLHAHGVTVALGTDAAVCNNATDMFLEMRMLGLSQKLRYGADSTPAEQILRMATRSGAAALGGADRFGHIAEGMAADLVLVDIDNPRLQPLVVAGDHENVAANLVYAATGSDVTDVMVDGRWIVRRRVLQTIDGRSLWRETQRAARLLHTKLRQTT
jgi:5-methylthioadenosine/S-adenosylhomocysteine deaminase